MASYLLVLCAVVAATHVCNYLVEFWVIRPTPHTGRWRPPLSHTWRYLCHSRSSQPQHSAHHGNLCLEFRVYWESSSSGLVQAAFVKRHHALTDAVTTPLPSTASTAGAVPFKTRTMPTAFFLHRQPPALSYGRPRRPLRGGGVMVPGREVSVDVICKVLLARRSLHCHCETCEELESCRTWFGHLPTWNVGTMCVHPMWVGDSPSTHTW